MCCAKTSLTAESCVRGLLLLDELVGRAFEFCTQAMHGDVFNYVRVERDQTCPADNSDALTPQTRARIQLTW